MDIALRTDDILREIFSHLRPSMHLPLASNRHKPDRATYYNVALVCKSFSQHALDSLWLVMDDMCPLIDLIPNIGFDDDDGTWYLEAPLTPNDLLAFERYASRVKAFEFDYLRGIPVPILLHLLQVLNRRYLLPNLVHLRQSEHTDETFNFFISSTLEYIRVPCSTEREVVTFLSCLIPSAPRLQRLHIKGEAIPLDSWGLTHNFPLLKGLYVANELTVHSEDFTSMFPYASQLMALRARALVISAEDLTALRNSFRGSIPMVCFPILSELALSKPSNMRDMTNILIYPLFPSLTRLFFNSPHYTSSRPYTEIKNEEWVEFFSALAQTSKSLQSLEILYPTNGSPMVIDDADVGVNMQQILIRNFPRALKSFKLQLPVLISLPHTSIPTFSQCFPYLTELSLHFRDTALLPFASLAHLATYFPRLLELEISLDATTIDEEHFPVLSHRLTTLRLVENSHLENAELFAKCIDRLFPHLQRLSEAWSPALCRREAPSAIRQKLIQAEKILRMLQSSRQDEVVRMQDMLQSTTRTHQQPGSIEAPGQT